jgi:hypothetical protein
MPFLDSGRDVCWPVPAKKTDTAANPRKPRREILESAELTAR